MGIDSISIIIPVLNEEELLRQNLPAILSRLSQDNYEIIVVDGGSTDSSVRIATEHGLKIVKSQVKGRAIQMNEGATNSTGQILYFLHADTIPPFSFDELIRRSIDNGNDFGMFAYKFQPTNFWLRLNAYFTKFDNLFAGGGDQSLFIRREVFDELQGYNEAMPLMEDYDLYKRARLRYRYTILPARMTVSSRKYNNNSYLKVQMINLYTFFAYKLGANLEDLSRQYKKWLRE